MPKHPDNQIEELLRRFDSADAGTAWTGFLDQYAGLILKIAGQFEYEQDRLHDCFLFVCEKLSETDFKRLLQYRPRQNATFRSWLITVIFNLCVDWHRREFGRASLSPAISALPAFEQLVYRYSFEQGMTRQECLQALAVDFPQVTSEMLSEAATLIHRILSPRQRWQLGVRLHRRLRLVDGHENVLAGLPSPAKDPFHASEDQQQLERLQAALDTLSAHQRLLLYYRFNAGLTLEQIAQILHLGDTNRTWRQIQEALQALSKQYPSEDSRKYRKK